MLAFHHILRLAEPLELNVGDLVVVSLSPHEPEFTVVVGGLEVELVAEKKSKKKIDKEDNRTHLSALLRFPVRWRDQ